MNKSTNQAGKRPTNTTPRYVPWRNFYPCAVVGMHRNVDCCSAGKQKIQCPSTGAWMNTLWPLI